MRAKIQANFLSVDDNGFLLNVWFENAFCSAEGEAHVVSVLLAFSCQITYCHFNSLYFIIYNLFYYIAFLKKGQVVYNRNMDLMMIFIGIMVFLTAMVIHEVAHGVVAYWLGDDTAKDAGRLTFNPVAHFEPFMSFILPAICILARAPIIGGAKPVPVNPRKFKNEDWGMALVALAGPLSNFIMAFVGFAILMILNINFGFWANFLGIFIRTNLGLMLFNLLPIPPLDGSKIIYPLAPEFVQNFFKRMERDPLAFFVILMLFSNQIGNFLGVISSWILEFFTLIFV